MCFPQGSRSAESLSIGEKLCMVFIPLVAVVEVLFFTCADCLGVGGGVDDEDGDYDLKDATAGRATNGNNPSPAKRASFFFSHRRNATGRRRKGLLQWEKLSALAKGSNC